MTRLCSFAAPLVRMRLMLTFLGRCRAATLPTTTGREGSPSMVSPSMMRTSNWSTPAPGRFPWPTPDPTPTARSSSSAQMTPAGECPTPTRQKWHTFLRKWRLQCFCVDLRAGWTVSMWFLGRWWKASKYWRRWKSKAPKTETPKSTWLSLTAANSSSSRIPACSPLRFHKITSAL